LLPKVIFSLLEAQDWAVEASAGGYLPKRVDVSSTSKSVTIQLDRISSDNSGIVEVTVKDEDGKAVENAKVRLRYEDTETFAPYEARLFD